MVCLLTSLSVCATSVLRFITLDLSDFHSDITWHIINSRMWTVIEYNLGVILAGVLALRLPMITIFPGLLSQRSDSKNSFTNSTYSNTTMLQRDNTVSSTNSDRPFIRDQNTLSFHAVGYPEHFDDKTTHSSRDERYRSGMRTEAIYSEPPTITDGRRSSEFSHDILHEFPIWEHGVPRIAQDDVYAEKESQDTSTRALRNDEQPEVFPRYVFDPVPWRPLPRRNQVQPDPPNFVSSSY